MFYCWFAVKYRYAEKGEYNLPAATAFDAARSAFPISA